MKTAIYVDAEVRSHASVVDYGPTVHASHPTTEVICLCWAIGTGQVQTWRHGDPEPAWVAKVRANPSQYRLVAHNAQYEMAVIGLCLGWDIVQPALWDDTAARAAVLNLPRSLAGVGTALGLPADVSKSARGKVLIKLLCGPQPDGTYNLDPELLQEMADYCAQDIEALRAVDQRLLPLPDIDRRAWELDCIINARGMPVDVDSVHHALALLADAETSAQQAITQLSKGAVTTVHQRARIQAWLADEHAVQVDSLAKAPLADLLASDTLPPDAAMMVQLRLSNAMSSTGKYKRLAVRAASGRAYDVLMFAGAGQTRRWAGRVIQPHNLPRTKMDNLTGAVECMALRDLELLSALWGNPMDVLSQCLRLMICAPDGMELLASDYSAIEGRLVCWYADEAGDLEVFRTTGRIYEKAAGEIYGRPADSIAHSSDERTIGKVATLALGFQGGAGAMAQMAASNGVDLDAIEATLSTADQDEVSEIQQWWQTKSPEPLRARWADMTRGEAFGDLVKRRWRLSHPGVVALWDETQRAAVGAIQNPGRRFVVRDRVAYQMHGDCLFCLLPSGGRLAYWLPKVADDDLGRPSITFKGSTPTGAWSRQYTYGGKLVENYVQATARDILVEGMLRLDAAGWDIVLHVHDEAVALHPTGARRLADMDALMAVVPDWAPGLPLAAEGFTTKRYRK